MGGVKTGGIRVTAVREREMRVSWANGDVRAIDIGVPGRTLATNGGEGDP